MISVNEYFDGKVKSLGFENKDGKFTSGVMVAGDYEFGTSTTEYMTLVSGEWEVKLPGAADFESFEEGSTFKVEANQKFQLRVVQNSAYLCAYE
jgi:uncharacterized protein YaiE (UPF0345 family)